MNFARILTTVSITVIFVEHRLVVFHQKKFLLLSNFKECSARKYIDFINDFKACLYNYCYHTCQAKDSRKDLAEKVAKAITINRIIKPSAIESNTILADLRDRKKWEDVNKTVKSITNIRKISNKKKKDGEKVAAAFFNGVCRGESLATLLGRKR